MKVYIPGLGSQNHKIGGGWTFLHNFVKHTTLELTPNRENGDVMFVANPMQAERDDFASYTGKKVVMRLDNIPEDWNNRGTAISKLKDFITFSHVLIFQSEWSREKYSEFILANLEPLVSLYKTIHVIHNGVDTELFTPDGENIVYNEHPVILFVKSSRNENKRYPEAMEMFRRYYAKNPKSKLLLVGQFADDLHKYNFGFYNGENVQYLGVPSHQEMPMIYRSADILYFPAYADAAPNVVLEAMSSGVVPIIHPYGGGSEFMWPTDGGTHQSLGVISTDYPDYERLLYIAQQKDRSRIRDHIVKNFDIRDCVKKYEEVISG